MIMMAGLHTFVEAFTMLPIFLSELDGRNCKECVLQQWSKLGTDRYRFQAQGNTTEFSVHQKTTEHQHIFKNFL